MKFDELDTKMRVFETAHDHCALPGLYMVARIDGRSFTKLTKETHAFEAPFDVRVRDMMLETIKHLMDCGFDGSFGYTQSDEISLLFDRNVNAFHRKLRKYHSVLAGEASAKFSVLLGSPACFDCRISLLPREQDVVDYFRWRQEDAHRNALSAHCYWMLRKEGVSMSKATQALSGKSVAEKNELLFERGVNFNNLPAWQKRGSGVIWEKYDKIGKNPITGKEVPAQRRRLKTLLELPLKDEYDKFVLKALREPVRSKK